MLLERFNLIQKNDAESKVLKLIFELDRKTLEPPLKLIKKINFYMVFNPIIFL